MVELDYFDIYKKRVSGQSNTIDNSKISIDKAFSSSPFLDDKVMINGNDSSAIVTQGKNSDYKTILLQSSSQINIGDTVTISDKNYLVIDFQGEGIYSLYPTASLQLCNSNITIKSIPLPPIPVGYDDFMNPIYPDDYDPAPQEIPFPAIIEKYVVNEDTGAKIALDEDKIKATISYVDLTIKSFWVYGEKYDVYSKDLTKVINEKGLLILYGERSKNGGTV